MNKNMSVGDRLKQIRLQHGLTQGQIGKIIERSGMFVCKAEKGRATLRPEQISVLAEMLDVREEWLKTGIGARTENEEKKDCRSIGERIYQIRREKHLNQTDFASLLGISRNTISLLERRKISASPALIRAVVEKLNVDENWLRSGERTDVTDIEERLAHDPEARREIIDFLKRRYRGEIW